MDHDGGENQGVDDRSHRTNEVCLFFIALTVVGGQMSSVLILEDSTSRSRRQKLGALNVYRVNLAFAIYRQCYDRRTAVKNDSRLNLVLEVL